MSKLLNNLLDFLSHATSEQLEENWKYLEPYEDIGPNAKEFVEYCMKGFQYSCNTVVINDKAKSEYNFGLNENFKCI